jgi:hypothetical protein
MLILVLGLAFFLSFFITCVFPETGRWPEVQPPLTSEDHFFSVGVVLT